MIGEEIAHYFKHDFCPKCKHRTLFIKFYISSPSTDEDVESWDTGDRLRCLNCLALLKKEMVEVKE